ncbi:MAG: hypothetical protein ACFFEA_12570 [Candidatus Thorarchaeota archaeon]
MKDKGVAVLFVLAIILATYYAPNINGKNDFAHVPNRNSEIAFFLSDQLSAPQLISPSDDSHTEDLRPVFKWTAVSNATSYTLQLDKAENFSTTDLIIASGIETTNYTPPIALSPALWYWRVRAVNVSGPGPFSEIWRLGILPERGVPTPDFTPFFLVPFAFGFIFVAVILLRKQSHALA